MNDKITLSDGRELTWDEFCTLSKAEQEAVAQTPDSETTRKGEGHSLNRKELLPRIRAAAESNKITEADLLAFIKIMHDIFFPPAPLAAPLDCRPPKSGKKIGGGAEFKPKPVMTPAGRFESIAAATRFYQTDPGRIRAWIKKSDKGFYFL
jgi:hypothetical protein